MASIEYNLFRIKLIKSAQYALFSKDITPKDIFLDVLKARPTIEVRKGSTWHIGNVRHFPDDLGYFAVGRTTKTTNEKYDETTGDFLEEDIDTSPYTHCVFNARLGFIGIGKKAKLSPTTRGIATKIAALFASADIVRLNDISVEVAAIPNPEGFISALGAAYRVSAFTATFTGPNPFDADELFQRPLSVYLSEANGTKGRTQISGEDLDREVIQAVSRSTASTGNEASARIMRTSFGKRTTINLKGDPVKRTFDEEVEPQQIAEELTKVYGNIRHDPES